MLERLVGAGHSASLDSEAALVDLLKEKLTENDMYRTKVRMQP